MQGPLHERVIATAGDLLANFEKLDRLPNTGSPARLATELTLGVTLYHQLSLLSDAVVPNREARAIVSELDRLSEHPGMTRVTTLTWCPTYVGVEGPVGPAIQEAIRRARENVSAQASAW